MLKSFAPILFLFLHTISSPVVAEGRVPFPEIPKGKGDNCILDTAYMRSNHMEVVLHHRDDTVHQGKRTKRFSLIGCISCHAVPGADKKPVTVKSPKHFCRSCHDYAAVKIDCFQCHTSVPPTKASLK